MIEIQAELRQKIYGRSGSPFGWEPATSSLSLNKFNPAHTLPNYGIGYRWEFKKR